MPLGLKRGSTAHAMFLFNLCLYMRGGAPSIDAAKRLGLLYTRRPKLFDAASAAQADPESITMSLERVGLMYGRFRNAKPWVENSLRLTQWYDGDPRKIYAGVEDTLEIRRRVMNNSRQNKLGQYTRREGFWGFGFKMTDMLTYYLKEAGMIDPPVFSIPVDFHVMRLMLAHELVDTGTVKLKDAGVHELVRVLQIAFIRYRLESGIDETEIANALWLFSKLLCAQHPGNRTMRGSYNGQNTPFRPYNPTWNNRSDMRFNARSCGNCPIEKTCKSDIPNGPYNITGEVMILRPRTRPERSPQLTLPQD